MSLEKDITAVKALVEQEQDIFKPASTQNLAQRHDQEALVLAREEAAEKRAHAARIAEFGPKFGYIVDLASGVRRLDKEYVDVSEAEYLGHYGAQENNGHPGKISFNIKIYDQSIPDDVQEKLEKYNMLDSAYEMLQDEMGRYATDFFDELLPQYPFLEKWYGEGRSGGWVVFEISDVAEASDCEDLLQTFETVEIAIDHTDSWNDRDFLFAYKQLTRYQKSLNKRMSDLDAIERKIEKGKRTITKWLSSKEYWEQHFEYHKDDIAEQDAEMAEEEKGAII